MTNTNEFVAVLIQSAYPIHPGVDKVYKDVVNNTLTSTFEVQCGDMGKYWMIIQATLDNDVLPHNCVCQTTMGIHLSNGSIYWPKSSPHTLWGRGTISSPPPSLPQWRLMMMIPSMRHLSQYSLSSRLASTNIT